MEGYAAGGAAVIAIWLFLRAFGWGGVRKISLEKTERLVSVIVVFALVILAIFLL